MLVEKNGGISMSLALVFLFIRKYVNEYLKCPYWAFEIVNAISYRVLSQAKINNISCTVKPAICFTSYSMPNLLAGRIMNLQFGPGVATLATLL